MSNLTETFGSISVVIPAYRAQNMVCGTLDATQDYLERIGIEHEIIVVDNASPDGTADRVEQRGRGVKLLRNDRNYGKGYSVRRGMRASRCAWVLFMDVDNATAVDQLERFAPLAGDHEILIASRNLCDSRIVQPQPRFRQLLGRTFPYIVRAVALPDFLDTQCGFKVFRQDVAKELSARQRSVGFCFDVELLLMATRMGYRIVEVPVDWDNPRPSTVHIGLDPVRMLGDLFRIVWRHRRSKYAPKLGAAERAMPDGG